MGQGSAGYAVLMFAALSLAACQARDTTPDADARTADLDRAGEAKVDPCALLTAAEIEEVTGLHVERTEPADYGATRVCNQYGSSLSPIVSITVADGMPSMASSADMAKWRKDQVGSYGDMKFRIEPVEGLGAPAIMNELEGTGMVGLEIAVRRTLLAITTDHFDQSKSLAPKAIARMP